MSASAMTRIGGNYEIGREQLSPVEFLSPRLALFGDYLLIPTSDSSFFSIGDYATVRVISGPDGTIAALRSGPSGPRFRRRNRRRGRKPARMKSRS